MKILNFENKFLAFAAAMLFMAGFLPPAARADLPANFRQAPPEVLNLHYGDQSAKVDQAALSSWQESGNINEQGDIRNYPFTLDQALENFLSPVSRQLSFSYGYSPEKIYNYIKNMASGIDVPAIEPSLNIENSR